MQHTGCITSVTGHVPHGMNWQLRYYVWQSWNLIHFNFISWAESNNRWRRVGKQCPEKIYDDALQKILCTKAKKFKPQARLEPTGAGIAQLVVLGLAATVSWVRYSLGIFSGRGDFPLELTWVQTAFPQTPSDESINRGLVYAHNAFHRTDSKDPDVHVLDGWMPATKNTPSTHHPRRRNVTTLMVGLKNGHIRKNLTQKWWTPEI